MKSYLFDCGNSNSGPIGFCARVKAESPTEALAILRKEMSECIEDHSVETVEYLRVYFNPDAVSVDDIEETSG